MGTSCARLTKGKTPFCGPPALGRWNFSYVSDRSARVSFSFAASIKEDGMETQELHRGRLIDHIQLVVRDLSAARRFYTGIFESLNIPIGGTADDYFWADELFISTSESKAAQGRLTGRHHLAFQAESRTMVDSFYKAALA